MHQSDFNAICFEVRCLEQCFLTENQIQQHNNHKIMTVTQMKERVSKDKDQIQAKFLDFQKAIKLDGLLANITQQTDGFVQKLKSIVDQSQGCQTFKMINELSKDTLSLEQLRPYAQNIKSLEKPFLIQQTIRAVSLLTEYTLNQTKMFKEMLKDRFDLLEVQFRDKFQNSRPKITINESSIKLPQQQQQPLQQQSGQDLCDTLCSSLDVFAQNYCNLPFEFETSLSELKIQVSNAKRNLEQLPEIQDYSEPLLQMALIKLIWYERFHSDIQSIHQSEFIKKHLNKMIPQREPYSIYIDPDHSLLALTIDLGRSIHGQGTLIHGKYMFGLGVLCSYRFNKNLILFERAILQEAYDILIEYDDILLILKARTFLSKTYAKQGDMEKACQGYDSVLDSDTWEVPVQVFQIPSIKIQIINIILEHYTPETQLPRYIDQLEQMQQLVQFQ